jgi:hypothetical protein
LQDNRLRTISTLLKVFLTFNIFVEVKNTTPSERQSP